LTRFLHDNLKNLENIFDEDLINYKELPEKDVVNLLRDKEAYKRTIAVKILSQYNKEQYIPLFCEVLKIEKKLYTKLELCTALENYEEKAVPYLMPLLGAIGNNQHNKIEIIDINKKSYPLPRDIIGRILIRIGPRIFPEIKNILLRDENPRQIHEAIDIIGHITWNYKNYSLEKALIEYYRNHKNNEFLEWKIIRAFQSFKSNEIKSILNEIIKSYKNKTIHEEAKRSLKRIAGK
jgi:hypothetical protein